MLPLGFADNDAEWQELPSLTKDDTISIITSGQKKFQMADLKLPKDYVLTGKHHNYFNQKL